MNERIKELIAEADRKCSETHGIYDEILAELIVRECADIAYKYDEPKLSGPGMIIGNRIEEHFGVDE